MTVEESQLVDQHRSQSKTLGVGQSPGGNLPVYLEDSLEMLVEILVGHAAQLVEDASDFDASIGVWVSSSFGGDQKPLLGAFPRLPDVGRVVVDVSEYEARLIWQLLDQVRGHLVVCCVGGSEPSRQRNPNLTDGYGQVQLPTVHPAVPAALGPVSLGVYCCMGYLARFLVFLVPHSAFCLQNGTVEGHRSPPALPGLEHFHQVAPQAADLLGESLGQSLQTPLEGAPTGGAPTGEASLLTKQIAHHPHFGGRFVEDCQELSHPVQPSYDHDQKRLQEELLRVDDGPSPAGARWRWRARNALDKTDQLDKDAVLSDHGGASESSVHGHTPSSEVSRSGASPDEVLY